MEQREIVVEELGQVDVNDGAQHEDVLILLRVFKLESVKVKVRQFAKRVEKTAEIQLVNINFYS